MPHTLTGADRPAAPARPRRGLERLALRGVLYALLALGALGYAGAFSRRGDWTVITMAVSAAGLACSARD